MLTSFLDLAGNKDREGAFSIEIETGLVTSLLFLFMLDATLGMNLEEIFDLSIVDLLPVKRISHLAL